MADKEVTVFVIDVSKSMANKQKIDFDGNSLQWCLEYVWDKLGIKILAGRKTDYVAVVVVGSVITDNPMGNEEAYEHVRVVLPLPRRDSADLRNYAFSKSHVDVILSEVSVNDCENGDILSGLIIGVQMITEFCLQLKFKKNLILLSAGELLSDFTDAEAVAAQIQSQGINLSILGVGFDDPNFGVKEEDKSERKRSNEKNLRQLCKDSQGTFATYAEVAASLATPRIKPVRPVTTFRGILSIGDGTRYPNSIQISVERYPKTKQAKVPTATKFSGAAETRNIIMQASQGRADFGGDDSKATHQVVPSRTYKLQDGQELPDRSQLEKGYSYGTTVVPISKADEDFLQFQTIAGIEILGFLDASQYTRFLSMGEASLIVAQKGNSDATLALSSLIHALYESESYALARFVRKDMVPPAMVLLAPNIEADFESLLEVGLPFAEDVRQYKFAPLDKIKTPRGDIVEQHRYLPSQELKSSMSAYMDLLSLDSLQKSSVDESLSPADDVAHAEELSAPEDTYSFGVHRVMQAIMFRAFHSETDPIPPPSDAITRPSHIPAEILHSEEFKNIFHTLTEVANVKKVPPKVESRRRRGERSEPVKTGIDLDELLGGSDEEDGIESRGPDARDAASSVVIASIGHSNPAKDFEAMMKHDDLVDAAFQQVQPVLEEMVHYSLGHQTYISAINTFKVFRKHAIEQEEAELFDAFLQRFEQKMSKQNRHDFVELLKTEKITLIEA